MSTYNPGDFATLDDERVHIRTRDGDEHTITIAQILRDPNERPVAIIDTQDVLWVWENIVSIEPMT